MLLECLSCKRGTSNERTLYELEQLKERKSLITDTENEKDSFNKSEYAIVVTSPQNVV